MSYMNDTLKGTLTHKPDTERKQGFKGDGRQLPVDGGPSPFQASNNTHPPKRAQRSKEG